MTADERRLLLDDWSRGPAPARIVDTAPAVAVTRLFEAQAETTPRRWRRSWRLRGGRPCELPGPERPGQPARPPVAGAGRGGRGPRGDLHGGPPPAAGVGPGHNEGRRRYVAPWIPSTPRARLDRMIADCGAASRPGRSRGRAPACRRPGRCRSSPRKTPGNSPGSRTRPRPNLPGHGQPGRGPARTRFAYYHLHLGFDRPPEGRGGD